MNDDALARVERACTELLADGEPINFTRVASRAGISRASLYRNDTLRAVVEEHRAHSVDPRTLSGLATEIRHLRTALEVMGERVMNNEERLRHIEGRAVRKSS